MCSAASGCGFAASPSWTLRSAGLSLSFRVRKQGLSTFIHSLHTHFPYPLMLVPADSYDKPLSRAGYEVPPTTTRTTRALASYTRGRVLKQGIDACAWVAASVAARGGWAESTRSRDMLRALVAGMRVCIGGPRAPGPRSTAVEYWCVSIMFVALSLLMWMMSHHSECCICLGYVCTYNS